MVFIGYPLCLATVNTAVHSYFHCSMMGSVIILCTYYANAANSWSCGWLEVNSVSVPVGFL